MPEPIINIIEAVHSLDAGAIVSFSDEPTDETEYLAMIDWDEANANSSHPTWAAVTAERTTMQSASDDMQYYRDREKAYPPMGDQWDAKWKGGQDEIDMKAIIDQVKLDYPKP